MANAYKHADVDIEAGLVMVLVKFFYVGRKLCCFYYFFYFIGFRNIFEKSSKLEKYGLLGLSKKQQSMLKKPLR